MNSKMRIKVREVAVTLELSYRSIYRDCKMLGIKNEGHYKAGLRPVEVAKVIESRIARSA